MKKKSRKKIDSDARKKATPSSGPLEILRDGGVEGLWCGMRVSLELAFASEREALG